MLFNSVETAISLHKGEWHVSQKSANQQITAHISAAEIKQN